MWWLVPVDRENRDIFCVSGSLLRRWRCFEFANRDTKEKMVVGRSRGLAFLVPTATLWYWNKWHQHIENRVMASGNFIIIFSGFNKRNKKR